MSVQKRSAKKGFPIIDDSTARKIIRIAHEFYSDPAKVKKFRKWHLETYGYLSGTGKKK